METFSPLFMCVMGCVLAALLSSTDAAGDSKWSYLDDATGPNNWTEIYEGCSGMKQSPINIVTAETERKDLGDFTFVGFGESDQPEETSMTVENNGHTIVVEVEGDYQVSGAGLGDTAFKMVQFHFHWGSVNSQGSEHTINGKAYPAEVHFVCYNTKYENLGAAVTNADGLTVLGFFLEVQDADNTAFAPIFDLISNIQYYHDEEELETGVVFKNIFPADLSMFYRYSGSLTTPTCNEVVTWNVFATPIKISQAQLMTLRKQFVNEEGASANITLTDNFRPVQAVNDRTIYLNSENGAPGLVASYSLIAMVLVKAVASVFED